jgi:hypothetical protein
MARRRRSGRARADAINRQEGGVNPYDGLSLSYHSISAPAKGNRSSSQTARAQGSRAADYPEHLRRHRGRSCRVRHHIWHPFVRFLASARVIPSVRDACDALHALRANARSGPADAIGGGARKPVVRFNARVMVRSVANLGAEMERRRRWASNCAARHRCHRFSL